MSKFKYLFTDLGGVLLTNGWDRHSRAKASEIFGFDLEEFEQRHQLLFGDYECGKTTLETYLTDALFYKPRLFTMEAFIEFMYAQSQPYPEMIEMYKGLKKEKGWKIVAISNEGRELTRYRIDKFKLDAFIDTFVVSCFIGTRKPDRLMWHVALDVAHALPSEAIYIDDRDLFVDLANEMGIYSIWHRKFEDTSRLLKKL